MPRFFNYILAFIFYFLPLAYAQEIPGPPGPNPPPQAAAAPGKSPMLDALELKGMEMSDVLKLLAAKSGLNIIAGKNISGRVTIYLQNVNVYDALTIILKANDLAYIEDRGVIQIVTAPEYEQITGQKFGAHTESAVIPLWSLKAADAVTLLSPLKSNTGKVVADEQSNSLIIEESPERLKQLSDYIKSIDIPTVPKVYKIQNIDVETIAAKLQEIASPKIGSVKFDVASNKLFVKDTSKKLQDMEALIAQIDIPRETKVFRISYAKAEVLAKTVTPLLTKDIGTVQFDERSNVLVVSDIRPKINAIAAMVEALDRYDRQVLIEAKIVQITLSDAYQMGIDWDRVFHRTDELKIRNNFSLPGVVAGTSPLSTTTIGSLTENEYSVVLTMIATLGKSRLLSNPRIAVINNQEAKILVGSTTPYITSSTTTPATGAPTTAETVNFIDTGVKLHVTPTIHDDSYITMKIKPEVSNIPKSITTSSNNQIPVVDTSEVETTIRVKDGVTIVIGGLIKDEVRSTRNKVPLLGDIPFVGGAFRNDIRSVDKTEIVIFLTPHIITGDVHVEEVKYPYPKNSGNLYYNPLEKKSSAPSP